MAALRRIRALAALPPLDAPRAPAKGARRRAPAGAAASLPAAEALRWA